MDECHQSYPFFIGVKNLVLGIFLLIAGSIWLSSLNEHNVLTKFYFACGLFVATIHIISGILLISLAQDKGQVNLLHILLDLLVLFALSLYIGLNIMNYNDSFPWTLIFALILCPVFNISMFYIELEQRSNHPVVAGATEIARNEQNFPLKLCKSDSQSPVSPV